MILFSTCTFGVPKLGPVVTCAVPLITSLPRVLGGHLASDPTRVFLLRQASIQAVVVPPLFFEPERLLRLQLRVRSPFLPPSVSLPSRAHREPKPQEHRERSASGTTRAFHAMVAPVSTSASLVDKTIPSSAAPTLLGAVTESEDSSTSSKKLDSLSDVAFPPPTGVCSPVVVDVLDFLLEGYDIEVHDFLISGFSQGFRVGFSGPSPTNSTTNNLSASQNEEAVSTAIVKELHRGHTAGPFTSPPLRDFKCSPLGAVPKKDGTHRIILDLSSPAGSSVNDGIPSDECSVHYTSFDDAVEMVRLFGTNCFLAKIDLKHAFRLCPVHPDDWNLLGYRWRGKYYFDVCLPFGMRSSPFIFTCFADALLWILVHKFGLASLSHYLDDFLLAGFSFFDCASKRDVMLHAFQLLGVPIAEDKLEGPAQVITFLGIEIDVKESTLRLPVGKLTELRGLVILWSSRRKCTKRELLSLIGSLSFACRVIKPGRMFLRRLIDLAHSVRSLHHHIDLTNSVREDLAMWSVFLESWNGCALFQEPTTSSAVLGLFTDVSGVGFGAFFNNQWFSYSWPSNTTGVNIALLELFAVFAAVSTWSSELCNRSICVYTDNEAIVSIWAAGTSRDKAISALLRLMFFLCTGSNISLSFRHVPGVDNVYADLLSRLQVDRFLSLCPSALRHPSVVPDSVWQH